MAEEDGIRRIAYAGQDADVSYTRRAWEELPVQVVDHGIDLAEDTALFA